MSAAISNQNGVNEIFVTKVPAWHGLGTVVQDAPTWQDAARYAHLEWTISKLQLVNPRTNDFIPSFALVRDDNGKWLSTVGPQYTPIQNSTCFEFCDALLATKEVRYESAGALGNGEKVWCLARLVNADFEPVKGDKHETYLLFTDSRDGRAARLQLTTTRVVCQNTLNIAIDSAIEGQVFKMSHTASVKDKLVEAKRLVSTCKDQVKSIELKFSALARKKVTAPQFEKVMENLFPGYDKKKRAENKAAEVANNFMTPEITTEEGSAFQLLQSVTRYIDHQRTGLKVGDRELSTVRSESALFGNGSDFKTRALNIICSAVDLSPVSDIDAILNKVELAV